MKTTLQSLRDYQEVLIRIAELDRLLSFVPPEIIDLENEWKAVQNKIEELKKEKTALKTKLREQETLLAETTGKSQKFEKDLHEVTNTKEYHAVLKEIDTVKKQLHSLNEDISQRMITLEEIQRNVEECVTLEEESRGQYETAVNGYREGLTENKAEREEKLKLKGRLAGTIPERLIKKFDRIAARRNGVGLAPCVGSVCLACNVRVRPSVVDRLRRYQGIITCESCKRILIFSEAGA